MPPQDTTSTTATPPSSATTTDSSPSPSSVIALEDVPVVNRMDTSQQYSDEELAAALERLYQSSSATSGGAAAAAADDCRHLYGFENGGQRNPDHQLSVLQKITATVFLDYERYLRRQDDGAAPPSVADLDRQASAFAARHGPVRNLRRAVRAQAPRMALAAEFKRASPSKGSIIAAADELSAGEQALRYARAGADVVSVLTEPRWFRGTLRDLTHARLATTTVTDNNSNGSNSSRQRPAVLRKDFITTEYQIAEAAAAGADTVLLIVAVLPVNLLRRLVAAARLRGLEPLVEVHADAELAVALAAGARVVGVNNRNLHTFRLDLGTAERAAARLAALHRVFRHDRCRAAAAPDDDDDDNNNDSLVLCALSGMSTCFDVDRFRRAGVGMCLIGESLMRAADPAAAIASLCLDPADFAAQRQTVAAGGGAYTAGTQLVKVCGVTEAGDALAACRAGANLVGVIFAERSKRRATPAQAAAVVRAVREFGERPGAPLDLDLAPVVASGSAAAAPLAHLARCAGRLAQATRQRPAVVGVFQNQGAELVRQMVRECGLDLVQLHGQEGMAACRECPVPVLRVVDVAVDAATGQTAPDAVEQLLASVTSDPAAILLDTSIKGAAGGGGGGTGVAFDWNIAERLQAAGLPVIVAGGLTPATVQDCVGRIRPFGVDVSSGVEAAPGQKDHDKVRDFVQGARAAAVEASKGF